MENYIRLIEQNLECQDKKRLISNLSFIQSSLFLLFDQIKVTNSYDEAVLIFKVLEDIQFVLAKAVFKDGIVVTPKLRKFISDFDRIDDEGMRNYLYLKIKSNEYVL